MHSHIPRGLALVLTLTSLCFAQSQFNTRPAAPLVRQGDEIVVCGQLFHTSAPVVLWMVPGGYDAYRVEKHFSSPATRPAAATSRATSGPTSRAWRDRQSVSIGYSQRKAPLTDEEVEQTRNGNWTLPMLQDKVDQFVLHYD